MTLDEARAEAARLRSVAEALSAQNPTDNAIVSGIRRKPNARADAARWARFDREGEAWKRVAEADARVKTLEARLAAEARNTPVPFTVDELRAARLVRDRHGWHRVAKVNAKSVSVETGYSWTDRIPVEKILEVRCA